MFSKYATIWLRTYGEYLIELHKYRNHPVPRMYGYVKELRWELNDWDNERLRNLEIL